MRCLRVESLLCCCFLLASTCSFSCLVKEYAIIFQFVCWVGLIVYFVCGGGLEWGVGIFLVVVVVCVGLFGWWF